MKEWIGRQYWHRMPAFLDGATEEIRVAMFVLQAQGKSAKMTSGALCMKLVGKVMEGKRVRVLLSSAAGGRAVRGINGKSAAFLTAQGVEVRNLGVGRVCHAKLVMVDESRMAVGSHNWTPSSLAKNFEISMLVDDEVIVGRVAGFFDGLWPVAREF